MCTKVYKMHFYPCPSRKHKGEPLQAVQDVDISNTFLIEDMEFMFSDQLPIEYIQSVTFDDFTVADWEDFIKVQYRGKVFGMLLLLKHDEDLIVTFRPYNVRLHRYYEYAMEHNIPFQIIIKYAKDSNNRLD